MVVNNVPFYIKNLSITWSNFLNAGHNVRKYYINTHGHNVYSMLTCTIPVLTKILIVYGKKLRWYSICRDEVCSFFKIKIM